MTVGDRRRGRTPLVLLSAMAVASVVGCSGALEPEARLLESRALWEDRGPVDYRYIHRQICGECLPELQMEARVTVVSGEVAGVTLASGAEVPADRLELFPTVEGLFAIAEAALANADLRVEVEYDPELGYPRRLEIEHRDEQVVDGDVTYLASGLEELSISLRPSGPRRQRGPPSSKAVVVEVDDHVGPERTCGRAGGASRRTGSRLGCVGRATILPLPCGPHATARRPGRASRSPISPRIAASPAGLVLRGSCAHPVRRDPGPSIGS